MFGGREAVILSLVDVQTSLLTRVYCNTEAATNANVSSLVLPIHTFPERELVRSSTSTEMSLNQHPT